MKKENNLNWPNINFDYISLYDKCRNHHPSDFDKIVRYVTELRMKYKNKQNG